MEGKQGILSQRGFNIEITRREKVCMRGCWWYIKLFSMNSYSLVVFTDK